MRIKLRNWRSLPEFLMRGSSGQDLVIPRGLESSHAIAFGATGVGKSSLEWQYLFEIARRGETAVVFDPHQEYRPYLFDRSRGDVDLNALHDSCPYWASEKEALSEPQAKSMAVSLFPPKPRDQPFFREVPADVMAYLLDRYSWYNSPDDCCSCENLARWLSAPRLLLTPRLKGTQHAVSTDKEGKDQSQGLWATLGQVVSALKLMPLHTEARTEWTVREWLKERRGWLWITSTADTLDALRPLQSLWIDMIIMGLQSASQDGMPRVHLMIDELSRLNRLPQLQMALTGQRKTGNPIFVACQGISQLREIYGDNEAETLVSQPYITYILRVKEDTAAEHLSRMIGDVELDRAMAPRPAPPQRVISRLVIPSEITGLRNLHGYALAPGIVCKFKIKRIKVEKLLKRQPDPEPREIPRMEYPDDTELAAKLDAETKPKPDDRGERVPQPGYREMVVRAGAVQTAFEDR